MAASPYTIRNYRHSDFDSLAHFILSEPYIRPATPQMVADWLAWPGISPEKDLFIVEIGNRIVGYMNLRPETDIGRVMLSCRLHADHRRKGLAAKLLECALRRAREWGVNFAHVDVMADNKVAIKALEKHGFKPVRQYYVLKLDMSRVDWDEAEQAARGCRHLVPGEEAALAELQNRSFTDHWGYNPNTEETIEFAVSRSHTSPEDVVLACEEGSIAGFCRTEITGTGEGRISMMGTDPDFRGRGVGRKSLLAGLLYLRSNNVHTTYLNVDSTNEAAYTLYESVGFVRSNILWTYELSID
jgi:mycothiol synthase